MFKRYPIIRRKSSGLTRSRFDVDGNDMMGPPRPSRPPEMNAMRSCNNVKMSSARMPFSIVYKKKTFQVSENMIEILRVFSLLATATTKKK